MSILLVSAGALSAQCDAEVSGVMTYCRSFRGSGGSQTVFNGYFVGFRVTSYAGDTLNVVDIDGVVPMNRGKRIDNIDTQQEPTDTTRVPLRIAGGLVDTVEYWYFGPYPNGADFNIALVDPNGQCDTVFVASGVFDCADFTPYTDPGACDSDVPLYFLDFEKTTFTIGGGNGGNENIDEVFLIMARSRENVCCDLQPANSTCFEFVVRLSAQDIGIVIDDVGSGSSGGKIYADSLASFACTGNVDNTWPFQQDNGMSSDITPLCLVGGVQDWLIMSCKPGGNVTNVSIDAIAAPFSPPEVTIEPCNVMLQVVDADTAFWTSPDDPMLLNFDTCTNNNLSCSFLYDVATFGEVTACEGDTFYYIAAGRPIASDCFAADTFIYDTTYVVVYPVFDAEINAECNMAGDSVILTAEATSLAVGCNYNYDWSTGQTSQSITVVPDGAVYSVTITRADFPPGAEMCVSAEASIAAFPVFVTDCSALTDMQFACIEEVPDADTTLVSVEGCGEAFVYSADVQSGGAGCIADTLYLTRYYIIDFDGDTTLTTTDRDTCTQVFTIVDDELPMISCPADITVDCSDPVTPDATGLATATDNCTGVVDVSFSDATIAGTCADEQTINRTWTATDACGNTSTCLQVIFVTDMSAPDITCPANVTISCSASSDPMATGTATATDNCDISPVVTSADLVVPGACTFAQTINRTWTATDACGNTSTCLQVITVVDNTPPVVSCPSNVTINCTESTDPANTGNPTSTDDCDPAPVQTFGDIILPGACANSYTIQRFWFSTDACDNAGVCIQLITVADNTGPVVTCPSDATVSCDADMTPAALGSATATDDCASAVSNIVFSDNIVPGACPDAYRIDRRWTATDSCGNTGTCIQAIQVIDATAPVINCPADVTLGCTDSTDPDSTGTATATDNCDGTPVITYSDSITPGACAAGGGISRIWVATDNCGNTASCVQTIAIEDSTPPVISCPEDVTVGCTDSTAPGATGSATATDGCDMDPLVDFTDVTSPGVCAGAQVITRTWTALDACGNTATCVQSINVIDNIPPVILCPANVTIECTASTDTSNTGVATATDLCDPSPTVAFADASIPGVCAGSFTIQRTWTATDACGNTNTCVQSILVVDTTPPDIVCPADVTINCGGNLSPDVLGVATASDACSSATVTFVGDVSSGLACDSIILRTFMAMDACGNTATCVQEIRVVDLTPPVITCPDILILECGIDTVPETMATASDNCGGVPFVTYSDEAFPQPCGPGTLIDGQIKVLTLIVRTFTATDDCENSSTCTQHILIRDDTPPMLACAPDITIQCDQDPDDLSITGEAVATDLCDPDGYATILITIEDPGGSSCSRVLRRLWIASDQCGNGGSSEICTQVITIVDTTPPVISCPADITLACGAPLDINVTGMATATDNCQVTPEVTFSDTEVPGMCATSIQRTWIARDVCGNVVTCIQLISRDDLIPPTITCPADQTVDCTADTSPDSLGTATAADDCNAAVTNITATDSIVPGSCIGAYQILRTWTAADSCGNTATCIQTIAVQDMTPPVISCPADITTSCGQNLDPSNAGMASAIDACEGEIPADQITFSDNAAPGDCGAQVVIIRTWYAQDDCGNVASCTQHITVSDDSPPMIVCPPAPDMECGAGNALPPYASLEEFLAANGLVQDDCGIDSMSFTLLSEEVVGTGCGTILRTYQIADICGSTATCVQELAVNDNENPILSFPPDMIPLCCPELVEQFMSIDDFVNGGGTASDDCSLDSASFMLLTEITQNGDCNDHVIQTYIVSDFCGNTATAEVHYIIDRDPSEAVLVCIDHINLSLDMNCKATLTPELLLVTFDGCTEDFEVRPAPGFTLLPGNMVDGSYVGQTISVMVYDPLSGNRCWTSVTIEDKLPPQLTCAADTVQCFESTDPLAIGLPVREGVTIIPDGAGGFILPDLETCGPVGFTYFDEVLYHNCANQFQRTIYRHWTATDASGNVSSCQDTIYVLRATLDALILPPHFDGTEEAPLVCGGPCILPDGAPDIACTGEPSGAVCENMLITHRDERIQTCGGSHKIHRIWRMIDVCTGETRYYIQRIAVADTQPPVIACQDTVYANTSGVHCLATLQVPAPQISDACSEFSYTIFVSAGQVQEVPGGFVVSQLPPGDHVLRYVATDACFNQSFCESVLHVADRTAPVAVCDQHTVVSLSAQKRVSKVPALDFSDQSYDACGAITVYGRRMNACIDFDWTTSGDDDMPNGVVNGYDGGTEFALNVPFSCCDIGAGPLMIELMVVDESGNTARCMVEVTVQDKAAPVITCPSDLTLACGTYLDSAALYDISDRTFGTVLNGLVYGEQDRLPIVIDGENMGLDGIAFDNCNLILDLSVEDLRDMCGAGTIRRTFTATDPANGSARCTQEIEVLISDPLTEGNIIWPADVEVEGSCNMDPVISGEPIINQVTCDLTAFQHDDIVLGAVNGACAKILRTWFVIDWCQYNAQTGAGIWDHEQIIKVINSTGPEFLQSCDETTLCHGSAGFTETSPCVATVQMAQSVSDDCTAPAQLKWQYQVDIDDDGVIDYTSPLVTGAGSGATIVGSELHFGISIPGVPFNDPEDNTAHHRIIWTVRDHCSNESSCSQTFRVTDCKAPTPVCQNLNATLSVDGAVEIWAVDFNASSSDNCTSMEDLRYSFSSTEIIPGRTFDCDDVEDHAGLSFMVPVWVWDEYDNKAQCMAILTLEDPTDACGGVPNLSISGHILTSAGEPVELVHTDLQGGMTADMMTIGDGMYAFSHLPMMQDYTITPYRNDDPKNGVTTLDLVLIQKHLLGLQPFTNPYTLIAADVNKSKNISALDLVELRKLILGVYQEFPNNTSWRFIDAGTEFADPDQPYDFDEVIALHQVSSTSENQDFIAVKVGDVNGTVRANVAQIVTRNAPGQWSLELDDRDVLSGESVSVTLRIPRAAHLLGMQGGLTFDGLRFDDAEGGIIAFTDENYVLTSDGFAYSWVRESNVQSALQGDLLTLHCTALRNGRLSEMISPSPRGLASEVYIDEGEEISTLKLGLVFREAREAGLPFALYQNVPNPWQHETLIRFDLPEAMEYVLTIYDVMGRERLQKQGDGHEGANYVVIEDEAFENEEILYYHLIAKEYSAVKKMRVMRK